MKEISDFRNVKLIHMWRNFSFLHMFHVQKFEISPHDRFFLHGYDPCTRGKYQVWPRPKSRLKSNNMIFIATAKNIEKLIVLKLRSRTFWSLCTCGANNVFLAALAWQLCALPILSHCHFWIWRPRVIVHTAWYLQTTTTTMTMVMVMIMTTIV